jgi:hypothetical protein
MLTGADDLKIIVLLHGGKGDIDNLKSQFAIDLNELHDKKKIVKFDTQDLAHMAFPGVFPHRQMALGKLVEQCGLPLLDAHNGENDAAFVLFIVLCMVFHKNPNTRVVKDSVETIAKKRTIRKSIIGQEVYCIRCNRGGHKEVDCIEKLIYTRCWGPGHHTLRCRHSDDELEAKKAENRVKYVYVLRKQGLSEPCPT